MVCNGCRTNVEGKLNAIPGVNATADLKTGTVSIESSENIAFETLAEKLNNTHYKISEIKAQDDSGEIKFQCPMHCEDDKMYDEPGGCPICGMNLEKINVGKKKL